ncbi:TonB family protein [Erwinia rhapontici]|uniref:TonB family protein n=1 Tax=Erwinia rhapontici TaxID=55212 RepID=UPI001D0DA60A|nr:TonB family protein [Erwinia rhapontici]UDQ81052.1 TonB family protein [Erwinia rhapontici]
MKYLIALIICCLSVLTASAQQETAEKPEPVLTVKPAYPARAFAHRLNGHVVVSYDVNNDGDVINARVASSEPAGIFDEEALGAIRKWKFTPHKPCQGLTKDFVFNINTKSSVE